MIVIFLHNTQASCEKNRASYFSFSEETRPSLFPQSSVGATFYRCRFPALCLLVPRGNVSDQAVREKKGPQKPGYPSIVFLHLCASLIALITVTARQYIRPSTRTNAGRALQFVLSRLPIASLAPFQGKR